MSYSNHSGDSRDVDSPAGERPRRRAGEDHLHLDELGDSKVSYLVASRGSDMTRRRGLSGLDASGDRPRHRQLLNTVLGEHQEDFSLPEPPHQRHVRWRVPVGSLLVLALLLAGVTLWGVLKPSDPQATVIPVSDSTGTTGADSPDRAEEPSLLMTSESPGTDSSVKGTGTSPESSEQASIVVHVAGAVANPGIYQVPAGARVNDAVELAGGLLPDAQQAAVNLAEPAQDGVQIYIPALGEAGSQPALGMGGVSAQEIANPAAPPGLVNLNTASSEELQTLPKVGPVLAASIIAWREENGGFQHVDELDQVSGIGPATLAQLRDKVTV